MNKQNTRRLNLIVKRKSKGKLPPKLYLSLIRELAMDHAMGEVDIITLSKLAWGIEKELPDGFEDRYHELMEMYDRKVSKLNFSEEEIANCRKQPFNLRFVLRNELRDHNIEVPSGRETTHEERERLYQLEMQWSKQAKEQEENKG